MQRQSVHENWSSRLAFLLAAVGSAVGLGNIWKFPYEAGQGGGSAFVLVYLGFVFGIGVPAMIAELALGRRGRASPPQAVLNVARDEGRHPAWSLIGWAGAVGAFLVLSFYSVIGGWTLRYMLVTISGNLNGITAGGAEAMFNGFLAFPTELALWHAGFMLVTVLIVARGIQGGLEKAVGLMMPALFLLLLGLVFYAMTVGAGQQALRFLFQPDFSKLTPDILVEALGQAFFSLSLGLGSMLAYGAYVPQQVSIPRSALMIAGADTAVALLAGLMIFPLVFAYGLAPDQGAGLIFVTLPIAFGQMAFGQWVGTSFFLLLVLAALTSSISLLEPVVAWLEEHKGISRRRSALGAGLVIYGVGLGTVLSFNHWAEVKFLGRTFFGNIDYLTNSILMPLGGFFILIFTGWLMRRSSIRAELADLSDWQFALWRLMARFVCPLALILVFLSATGVI